VKKSKLLLLLLPLLVSLIAAPASAAAPIADVHIHYKWSQADVTSPAQALAILEQHNVGFAVVIGTPAELALELTELKPDKFLAVWSPYRTSADWSNWWYDPDVLERARSALADRRYRGIGELHLIGGFAPKPDSEVIRGLFQRYARFIEFHRHWLSTIDPAVARKIRWENALIFFRHRH
jgi:hypothetical protein